MASIIPKLTPPSIDDRSYDVGETVHLDPYSAQNITQEKTLGGFGLFFNRNYIVTKKNGNLVGFDVETYSPGWFSPSRFLKGPVPPIVVKRFKDYNPGDKAKAEEWLENLGT